MAEEDELMQEEMKKAHAELTLLENAPKNEPVDVATIHAFTSPREHRTMGKTSEEKALLLAMIAAKGSITKSRIRQEFVVNYMLMTRSVKGWGSEQAASVAKSRTGNAEPVRRGILGGMFRRKDGNQP